MNPTVYVETSVISYLGAKPSRDIVIAAHQQVTRRWWRSRRSYRLFVSQIVRDEAAVGDPVACARRLRILRGVPALAVTDEATRLAGELVRRGALPRKATIDAFHIGIAAAHQIEYLLTWNCKHIANATMRGTIEAICRSAGLTPPIICTPEELPSGSST
ncbi:MAG: type II toxin-antitoxin system VapC family toxin [Vicinamibacterales bacterium]